MDKEKNEGKITKEEFADRVIKVLSTGYSINCPDNVGLKECRCVSSLGKVCTVKQRAKKWQQAIKQGVEK